MPEPARYIGLMSGTSMDAVDAVILEIGTGDADFRLLGHGSRAIPSSLRRELQLLCSPGKDDIQRLGQTDIAVGALFAETALELLASHQLAPGDVAAIGSHGQTVRHSPPSRKGQTPFTLQIGDPNTIACITGITTVADFRRKDLALGGEAAPLAPAFHQAVFRSETRNRAIVNTGGIANITWLPATGGGEPVTGFDTGPANGLMDGWIDRHRNEPFDRNGNWAAGGTVITELLDLMLEESYLKLAPPKSTGRELFNLDWLDRQLGQLKNGCQPRDVQATLCQYTATTIADGLALAAANSAIEEVYVCGGGAFNDHLMSLLSRDLAPVPVRSTASHGIHPLHVEGAAFAWLAHQTLNRHPGNVPEVTGARRPAVLGGIYYP